MVTVLAITLLALSCRVRACVPSQSLLHQFLSIFADLAAFATMGTLETGWNENFRIEFKQDELNISGVIACANVQFDWLSFPVHSFAAVVFPLKIGSSTTESSWSSQSKTSNRQDQTGRFHFRCIITPNKNKTVYSASLNLSSGITLLNYLVAIFTSFFKWSSQWFGRRWNRNHQYCP